MSEQEQFYKEIKDLEAKLEAKKMEYQKAGLEQPEKETFRTVIREHITGQTSTAPAVPAAKAKKDNKNPQPPEVQQAIANLVILAFNKGIKAAVSQAKKTNDPLIIDLLHDALADEYYQKLLTSRQIKNA